MANTLEALVRPFQSPNAVGSDRVVIPASPATAQPIATLMWGSPGNIPQAQKITFDPNEKKPNKDKFKEKSRSTETVRISQPDNDANFVDVARIKEISFKALNTDTPQGGTTIAQAGPSPAGQGAIDGITTADPTAPDVPQTENSTGTPQQVHDSSYSLNPPPGDEVISPDGSIT